MARARDRVMGLLCAAVGLGGSLSFADPGDFVPRARQNGAYFDLFASYEMDDNRNVTQPYDWRDSFLRERVTLFSDGYVYHPRFLQYHASLGAALKQEDFEASYLDPAGWSHDDGIDYEARLFFLPEHPYNLELFALRYEPLYREYAALQPNTVETTRGAYFQYRKIPYLLHARYTRDTIDSGFSATSVDNLGLDGEYLKHFRNGNQVSFTAAYNPSRYTTSPQDLEGDKKQSLLGNVIDLKTVRLYSSATWNDYSQESALGGDYTTDQFSWYELLNVYFPHDLRADLSSRRQNNESTFPDPFLGSRELTDDVDDLQLDVVYRLYQSLDATYTHLDSTRTSSAGDTTSRFDTLNLNYTKIIPVGRLLLGTSHGRVSTDNEGTTDVALEPHPGVAVPGLFTLTQPDVTPGSVAVFLQSPVAPFNTILLTENLHYTLSVVGNLTEVNMLSLPPPFLVPGTFDLLASYSLLTGTFELESRTAAYSASVELFDQRLVPYYSYVAIRTDLTEGLFPGIPPRSTTNTLGLRYQKGPWRARGEYQDLDWEVSPYQAWRAEAQYVGPLNPTTTVYGTAQYLHRYFPQGTALAVAAPYTYQTLSASGNLQKVVPSQNLTFSVGATISRTTGLVDTDALSLNSSISWRVGKITLTGGANAYSYDNSGEIAVESGRTHQYYYVMLRRALF